MWPFVLCQELNTNQEWCGLLWHPRLRQHFKAHPSGTFFVDVNLCPAILSSDYTIFGTGLPDFSWYRIPKRKNIPKDQPKFPKKPNDIPNGHKI
jgi:hypothetical protein